MCTNKRKRRFIALSLIVVFVVLLSMLSCTFSVSAASTKYLHSTWNQGSISSVYDLTYGVIGENNIVANDPVIMVSGRDTVDYYSTPINFNTMIIDAPFITDTRYYNSYWYLQSTSYLNRNIEPGTYQIRFYIGVPKTFFKSYRGSFSSDGSYNPNGRDMPCIRYRDASGNFQTVLCTTESSFVPASGDYSEYRFDCFVANFTVDTSVFLYTLDTSASYSGNFLSWWNRFNSNSKSREECLFLSSSIELYAYSDSPASAPNYQPPTSEDHGTVDDYLDQEQETQDFIAGNDKEISDSLTIAGVFDNQYLFQAMQTIQDIYRTLTSSLPWLSTLITISVGLGVAGFVLNLVSIVFSRRK